MSQNLPTALGKYQVIREIARSNDIVYEGHDPVMNRRVALKELAVNNTWTPAQKEDRIRRFEREVKAAGSLQHPGIVTIFEFGEDQGHIYMAMEYLDGKTLRQEIESKGYIPQERAIEIIIEVLDALSYAHENGVVHRDIKPENIQIISNGKVKLTDFGIARLTYEPNLTMDGQVFGTPSFMSPEQVQGKDVDARTDIWAVGAVLYEAITGQKAFKGDSIVSISYAIMNTEPEQAPQITYGIQQVLRQALERNLVLRYSTAKAMIEGLNEVLEGLKSGATGQLAHNQTGAQQNYMYAGIPVAIPNSGAPPIQQFPIQNIPAQYNYGYAPAAQSPYMAPVPIIIPRRRVQLIKPTTRRFLSKLIGILITVGLLVGLVAYGADSMLKAVERLIRGKAVVGQPSTPKAQNGSVKPSTSPDPVLPTASTTQSAKTSELSYGQAQKLIEQGFELYGSTLKLDDPNAVVAAYKSGSEMILEGLSGPIAKEESSRITRSARVSCMLMMDSMRMFGEAKLAREMGYLALGFCQENSSNDEAKINRILKELGA